MTIGIVVVARLAANGARVPAAAITIDLASDQVGCEFGQPFKPILRVPVLENDVLPSAARRLAPTNPSHNVVGLRRRQIDLERRRASASLSAPSFAVALGTETRYDS